MVNWTYADFQRCFDVLELLHVKTPPKAQRVLCFWYRWSPAALIVMNDTHTHIKIRDLTCIPPLRPSKLSVLHVQIPQQAGIVCPPGLSCSKELQGQTWQVNLRVPEFTPKLSPILLKTQGPPDLLSSFLTTQPRVDLLPQCTPRINISSSCHHPGLLHWADVHIWMSYPLLCS